MWHDRCLHRFVPDDEKRRARETGEDAQAIPLLKRFTVSDAPSSTTFAGQFYLVANLHDGRPVARVVCSQKADMPIECESVYPVDTLGTVAACRPDSCA